MKRIILDLCGGTGSWSKPYKKAGFEVIVIDLKNGYDVTKAIINKRDIRFWTTLDNSLTGYVVKIKDVYGILAAPPCTEFSFARTNAKKPRNVKIGIKIVESCLRIIWACQYNLKKDTQKKPHLKFWALENPNGMLKWFLGKPTFEFSPYEFGDMYKKKTHLWGWFNNPIKTNDKKPDVCKFDKMATKDIHPEYYGKLTRQERRAITPKGFAKSFYEANK